MFDESLQAGRLTLPEAPSRRGLARARASMALQALAHCRLCLHACDADRLQGPAGRCHAGANARFFSAQTEVTDELDLLPTFAIALSGCNFRCAFCITGAPSWNPRAGNPLHPAVMARQAADAVRRGARTVMLLGGEPTIHLPALLEFIAALPDDVRLVLKTNAYFSVQARPLLDGMFDVWLPDLKFGSDTCARRLAGIPHYWDEVTANLRWMSNEAGGDCTVVRHLLMPDHVDCCWAPIASWLAHHLPRARVSLREGYWPAWQADRIPEINRTVTRLEWDRALEIAHQCRLELTP